MEGQEPNEASLSRELASQKEETNEPKEGNESQKEEQPNQETSPGKEEAKDSGSGANDAQSLSLINEEPVKEKLEEANSEGKKTNEPQELQPSGSPPIESSPTSASSAKGTQGQKPQEAKAGNEESKKPEQGAPTKKEKKEKLEEISKEDLIKHVERLNKKSATMSRRLELHEERYKTVSKSLEEKKSEREVLEKFISLVLRDTSFEKKKDYEYGYLVSLWSGLEEKRDEAKRKMEMEFQENLEKKMTQNADTAMKNQVDGLKRMIEGLEGSNKRLSGEILELNGIIKSKNEEIVRLKKIEEQFLRSKAEKLLVDLEKANTFGHDDIYERFEVSDRLDQLIKTQNELEAAYEKIEKLRDALKSKNTSQGSEEPSEEKKQGKGTKRFEKESQTEGRKDKESPNGSGLKGSFQEIQGSPAQKSEKSERSERFPSKDVNSSAVPTGAEFKMLASDERYQLSIKYLKNVILKYFIYIASSNTREAGMLMEVILDFLQVDHQERMLLENAKNKSNQTISDRNLLNNLVFWTK